MSLQLQLAKLCKRNSRWIMGIEASPYQCRLLLPHQWGLRGTLSIFPLKCFCTHASTGALKPWPTDVITAPYQEDIAFLISMNCISIITPPRSTLQITPTMTISIVHNNVSSDR